MDVLPTVNDNSIRHSTPPFQIDYPAESDRSQQIRELLKVGNYNEAYSLLVTRGANDPAAINLRGVLDAYQLGNGSDPSSAFNNFQLAAGMGYEPARLNMAISYIFGIGTKIDPKYGSKLLHQSIEKVAPQKVTSVLKIGFSLMQTEDFAEVIKSIRLEAAKGSPIAYAIEGALTAQGVAKEPCVPKCVEVAERIAADLKASGEPRLAALVEYNVNSEKKREAVQAKQESILRAQERYDAIARREALRELNFQRADPRAVDEFGDRGLFIRR